MTFETDSSDPALLSFYDKLKQNNLAPLWEILGDYVSPQPTPRGRSYVWRWREMLPLIEEAGERALMSIGERRVLNFVSPGLESKWRQPKPSGPPINTFYPGSKRPRTGIRLPLFDSSSRAAGVTPPLMAKSWNCTETISW